MRGVVEDVDGRVVTAETPQIQPCTVESIL